MKDYLVFRSVCSTFAGRMDDKRFLLSLIKEGEHQQQDFKYRVADACKLAKSVSAFANTDGGRLLIGVRDDGHLSGVRSEEEIYMMHQAAYKYCQPEASIKFDTYHAVSSDSANATPCLRTIVVATQRGPQASLCAHQRREHRGLARSPGPLARIAEVARCHDHLRR